MPKPCHRPRRSAALQPRPTALSRAANGLTILGLATLLGGCPATPTAVTPGPTTTSTATSTPAVGMPTDYAALETQTLSHWLAAVPSWGRQVGLHDYDGKVGDYHSTAVETHAAWLKTLITQLKIIDESPLTPDQKLDKAILQNRAELEHFNLTERQLHRTNPSFYSELFDVGGYVKFNYAPLETRARLLLKHEQAALKQTANITDNLNPTLSRSIVETAIKMHRGYAEFLLGDVAKAVSGVKDAAFQKQFADSNQALAAEAERVAKDLEEKFLPKSDDKSHVLGRERFLRFVQAQEGTAISLEAFKRMADEDLARNKSAYVELSKTVKQTRPTIAELLPGARRLVEQSRLFVEEKQLATIPSDDRCSVEESPPYMRWNAAFLNMPGPFDSAKEAFYYITLPNPKWPKKEQEEYIFPWGTLMATTVHEAYPGHFLQGLWARKAPSRVQKMADSYSFTEGWAHYTEQLMVEQGFGADDPQNRLGQLSDALLRNCRFVVSIGVHAEGMTLDQAAQRFVDDCFQDRATAREQAVRATFDPGYFAYTVGKLQILELRQTMQKELGDQFSLKRFHDALLSHGSPPLALLRERVRTKLTSNAK